MQIQRCHLQIAMVSWALLSVMLAASTVSSSAAVVQATNPVLWQIGQVDQNDSEFALAPNQWGEYSQDGFYMVGKSNPKTDWPYVQPGPVDAWAGSQPHTSQIEFGLAKTALQGTCQLSIALVDAQYGFPPDLQIAVNGQTWTRNAIPGLNDDAVNGNPAAGKHSVVTVDFPASLLKVGANLIGITTLKGSWILYDAITLTAPAGMALGASPPIAHLTSARWLHDVLTGTADALQQVLRLTVDNFGPARDAELRVSGEASRAITLPAGRSNMEVPFPESKEAGQSQVQLFSQGQPVTAMLTVDRQPCRHYTIYCIEQSHMDIGYAYLQPKALELHQQYLEAGLKANAETSALPPDDQFRWNVESLFEVDDWLKKASPDQIALFKKEAQSGGLGLSALYCNELTGLCRPEELVALLACANRLRSEYDVPIDSAMISDVPGYTWGMVPVLAQSGVKYFSWGPNPGDHLGSARDFDNQAFYWMSPSGKDKVLVWQGPNGYQPDFDPNEASLVHFLTDFDKRFPHDPYEMICDRHTTGDNGPADMALPRFVHEWNSRYAFPHLVLATTSRMFHDFEARYGASLPTVRGDYTGYWEDGAASSARETAINRNAGETLAQDEVLWSMLSPAQYPAGRFADAWQNAVLYDEHTWGSYNSWSDPEGAFTTSQWAFKRQYALNAQQQAQALEKEALGHVPAAAGSNTVAVFNTCSWQRSDLAIIPAAMSQAGDIVRDGRGRAVPSQRLSDGSLAFMATDVPAMGSCKFTIAAGQSKFRGSAVAAEGVLKTGRMVLRFNPQTGAITSWQVNGIAQDLVNSGDKTCRGLNDYLYVLGSDNSKVQYASGARLTVVDAGPLVASIRVDSSAPGCKSLSRLVQVVDGLDEVRITDTLDKSQVHEDEAVDLGFNFNIPGSTVRMEMPWAVVRPDVDQTPNANKNIYPVDRWVDVSNGKCGVTSANLDSPMLQIGAITLPRENNGGWLKMAEKGSTLYWGVMNNYWHTNYKAYQPGIVAFRYTLLAHKNYDQAAAQRFGIGQSQPLIAAPVSPEQPNVSLPLQISNAAVMVTALNPGPAGKGWLVRLFNGSDHSQKLTLRWKGAKRLSLVRTDMWGNGGKPVASSMSLAPMEIVTLRVTVLSPAKAGSGAQDPQ